MEEDYIRNETTTGRIIEVNNRGNYIVTMNNFNPASAIRFNLSPETVISNWGGMLAVIKDACSTRTLIPGTSKESGILLPEELLITVSGDRLKRIALGSLLAEINIIFFHAYYK